MPARRVGSPLPFEPVLRTLPRRAHNLSRRIVRESQHWRMLEAITEAVGKHGYADATVAHVIALAGVSRKTFYEHFRDKEDCFLMAYEALSARLVHAMIAASADRPAGAVRRRAQMATYLDALARDPIAARVFVVDVLGAGPRALAARERVNAAFGNAVVGTSELVRRGAIVGGVNAITITALLENRAATLPRLLDAVCAFIECALRR